MRKFLIAAVFILGTGTGSVQAGSMLPSPSGPYSIGTQVRYWTDPSRSEDFNQETDKSSPRRLAVQIWYPAAVPRGNINLEKAGYHPHPLELIGDAHKTFGLPSFMLKRIGYCKTQAYTGVPVAGAAQQYPVIIFTHGLNGTMVQNSFQFQELASHGYIVVSPEHTNAAIGTVFPDGSQGGTVDGARVLHDDDFTKAMLDVWRKDTGFVLDQLAQINTDDPEHLLQGRMDLSRIGVFGHSLGGASAAYSLMEDDRIKAGINIDGFLPGKGCPMTAAKPFMEIRSRDNYSGPVEGFVRVKEDGNRRDVVFMKANHFSFTDLPLSFLAKPVTAPYIRKIHKELNAATLDFFNKSLKRDQSSPRPRSAVLPAEAGTNENLDKT